MNAFAHFCFSFYDLKKRMSNIFSTFGKKYLTVFFLNKNTPKKNYEKIL